MRAISVDLRHRACEAVTVDDLSCRAAARRFKVGVASVVRWCAQLKTTGSVAPQKQGGDRRSGRVEAEATFILKRISAKPDITLAELQAALAGRGVRVSLAALWRFFRRHDITLKTRPRTQQSRSVPTSSHAASTGKACVRPLIHGG